VDRQHIDEEPGHSQTRSLLLAQGHWIALITLLVTVFAAYFSFRQPITYTAQAEVLVSLRVFPGGTPPQQPDMPTERLVASSGAVVEEAARTLRLDPSRFREGIDVTVAVDTHVLRMAYTHRVADTAWQRATTLAQTYVQHRNRLPEGGPGSLTEKVGLQAADLITAPTRPVAAARPPHALHIGIALVLGLALGVSTALARDRLSDRLRGAVDLTRYAKVPLLAALPHVRRGPGHAGSRLVMLRAPSSGGAEAYKYLRVRLLQVLDRQAAKTLLVTSSTSGLGKTTVAANIAVALALADQRVVLVSGDVRRPRLHEFFGVQNSPGLTDVLEGSVPLETALASTRVERLRLLTAGSPSDDPAGLLAGSRMRTVLAELCELADVVVIDSPPVLTVAETVALAELADAVLLVEDAKRSTRGRLVRAVQEMEHIRGRLIGAVFNGVRGGDAHLVPGYLADSHHAPPNATSDTGEGVHRRTDAPMPVHRRPKPRAKRAGWPGRTGEALPPSTSDDEHQDQDQDQATRQ
jgi:capsular exopolysaccharide synthesis family protein